MTCQIVCSRLNTIKAVYSILEAIDVTPEVFISTPVSEDMNFDSNLLGDILFTMRVVFLNTDATAHMCWV